MPNPVKKIVVVGGGSAGWLSACRIAAQHLGGDRQVTVTLLESPDVPIIGVGEGTWPSMRSTLQDIGLAEDDLLVHCDASFKQGTCFHGWRGYAGTAESEHLAQSEQSKRSEKDRYLHPFSLPAGDTLINLADYWLALGQHQPFADFVCAQAAVINQGLAPKQVSTAPYSFNVNYAYHLDAGRFTEILRDHAVHKLQVQHLVANMTGVVAAENGDINALQLDRLAAGTDLLAGDLFVDCTGHRSLLLEGHYQVASQSIKQCLFNDTAIAVQVPYSSPDADIAPVTLASAQSAGWVWDIGLQSRRGIGHVFSSSHQTEDEAMQTLLNYLGDDFSNDLTFRTLKFEPSWRKTFWVNNCVAVGLSAGFVEPLEASALALVEASASLIAKDLPRDRGLMDVVAARFNEKMHHHWHCIVEFLKLHYCVPRNAKGNDKVSAQTDYWRDHQESATIPDALKQKLELWQQQTPNYMDAPWVDVLFPSASYQYVLYGMGFKPTYSVDQTESFKVGMPRADKALHEVAETARKLASLLPTNRELLTGRVASLQSDRAATQPKIESIENRMGVEN